LPRKEERTVEEEKRRRDDVFGVFAAAEERLYL